MQEWEVRLGPGAVCSQLWETGCHSDAWEVCGRVREALTTAYWFRNGFKGHLGGSVSYWNGLINLKG